MNQSIADPTNCREMGILAHQARLALGKCKYSKQTHLKAALKPIKPLAKHVLNQ